MHKIILAGSVVLGLSLGACDQETSMRGTYNCERGVVLDITFTDGEHVEIKTGENIYKLNRVESASGAKYENEGSIFISKGVSATFIADVGVKPVNCRRR
jgi:membrane-bound inhibitor of C-type lysozyme